MRAKHDKRDWACTKFKNEPRPTITTINTYSWIRGK